MPPPDRLDLPILHKIFEFYKKLYSLSSKISKRDRFGIYLKTENICLEIAELLISASLETKNNKLPILNYSRIKTELLKRIVRMAYELNIVESKNYLKLESDLQEISKMTNGWIRYLK